jgi:UDP-N-acetylglucosamine--N-acetylmuramyl-(pentapeptide) pyrophosphoryl-undecaprenol N-acetylglucosamine transferase
MIVFTGGGTGGHLRIVDSIANYIDEKIYIGSTSGQDKEWFANDTRFSQTVFLETTGVVNKKGFAKVRALWLQFIAVLQAVQYVKKSSGVFCVGGFSAAPAAIAAIVCFKPLYIHEQNSVTGKLNKILRPFSKKFFESFGKNRTSYPVKDIFFETARQRESLQTVIFLGGSQGARAINDIAFEVAKRYNYKIIHQCGQKDYERLKAAYEKIGREVELFTFSKQLHEKMREADLAVARAGASTLWELCANRLPTLFIPFPYAASNHQYFNAKTIVDMDAAWMVEEKDFDMKIFESIDAAALTSKSKKLFGVIDQGGAKAIAQSILS